MTVKLFTVRGVVSYQRIDRVDCSVGRLRLLRVAYQRIIREADYDLRDIVRIETH